MSILKNTILALLLFAVASASAVVHASDNDPVTLAAILKAASCPLTDKQQKVIDGIKPGEGMRESMGILYGMFEENQTKALIARLGAMPSRGGRGNTGDSGDRPERPRSLFQLIILAKEGSPLTEKQVKDLKNLTMERGGFRQMNEIMTDEQQEIMRKYMGDRQGGRNRR